MTTLPQFSELAAPPEWAVVDFISDIHLHTADHATFAAWQHYLESTPAQAVFILGDLFEVWVGDDTLTHHLPDRDDGEPDTEHSFGNQCVRVLKHIARQTPLFVMHGNRDFLLGQEFTQHSHAQLISDPTVLSFQGQRYLLTHGDALCTADADYQAFRAQVRSSAWQTEFLHKSIDERLGIARHLRNQSQARQAAQRASEWATVDDAAALQWLQAANCSQMIHGHTHQAASHTLAGAAQRHVLSDWEAKAGRLQVLRLSAEGVARIAL
jgi:UDP-2,3-diacylglucosamine hydrolase